MSLPSLQLDAFQVLARTLNFSRAAAEIHLTQSALTQRIQNLEDELNLTLFIRHPRGVKITAAGERLLRYCQARSQLEDELLLEMKGDGQPGLGGSLRVAAYSTVLRSVVVPALAPLLRTNPNVTPYFFEAETRALPGYLLRGEADFIVLDEPLVRADVESYGLGAEENVLVASRAHDGEAEPVYLDHDPEDQTTLKFLAAQGKTPKSFRRGYLDEIYGIMDGVALGLGRAVIPRHLAAADERLKIVRGLTPVEIPVHLHHFRQPFYTALHQAAVAELRKRCPKLLSRASSKTELLP